MWDGTWEGALVYGVDTLPKVVVDSVQDYVKKKGSHKSIHFMKTQKYNL